MKVTVITDLAAQPLSDQSTKLTPEQIALLALFGNGLQSLPGFFNASKTYKKGDVVMHVKSDGTIEVLRCKEDNVNGSFNASKWEDFNLIKNGGGTTIIQQQGGGTPTPQPQPPSGGGAGMTQAERIALDNLLVTLTLDL